jgi:hypothetical protein
MHGHEAGEYCGQRKNNHKVYYVVMAILVFFKNRGTRQFNFMLSQQEAS